MDAFSVYRDIQTRTNGQFLIGVVGPVRTGKSTFIRRFMEVLALPELPPEQQAEVRDALPLSGSGKLITTVEPKFIPKDALKMTLGEGEPVQLRLIDCVGFLIPDAAGNMEEDKERMVKTPWFDQEIPFHQAAELGTQKVIADHSTIGLVVTCDGSFGELPREFYPGGGADRAGAEKAGKAVHGPAQLPEALSGRDAETGEGTGTEIPGFCHACELRSAPQGGYRTHSGKGPV